MGTIMESISKQPEILIIDMVSSILATIFILLTRTTNYKIIDTLPANMLFNYIKNSKEKCFVFQNRLQDTGLKGEFIVPVPEYSTFPG